MRTTRQQQRAEAKVWRRLAEAMGVEAKDAGLCYVLDRIWLNLWKRRAAVRIDKLNLREREAAVRIDNVIGQAVEDVSYGGPYLSETTFGPDWDRCLFACLMAAVAEAGDMDVYRGED